MFVMTNRIRPDKVQYSRTKLNIGLRFTGFALRLLKETVDIPSSDGGTMTVLINNI
jgi:hypothetical protein